MHVNADRGADRTGYTPDSLLLGPVSGRAQDAAFGAAASLPEEDGRADMHHVATPERDYATAEGEKAAKARLEIFEACAAGSAAPPPAHDVRARGRGRRVLPRCDPSPPRASE